ncbi:V/A-type H+-transporting ATPase subunit F [Lachnospiraceae bacterium RM5]|nr:V/A-type H+-transporting ATPase subunit F [Lachnospiraceae bacterium RM5]
MKIFLISDNVDTQTGLRLAGIDGVVVHERNELKNALESVLLNKEVAIILITEKLSFEFPEIIDDIKLHRNEPLLVTIPDRHGLGRKSDFITSYVEDAIGLKL